MSTLAAIRRARRLHAARRRSVWRAEGRCLTCGDVPALGRARCDACLHLQRLYTKSYRERRRAA